MRLKKKHTQVSLLILLISFCLIINGCSSWGDVAEAYQIDQGNEPDNQDKMVRFQTTYFFRVVDSCNVTDGIDVDEPSYGLALKAFRYRKTGKLKIINDSLYRFRMTGKSSALFSTTHFESGVLREEQIDPFGSSLKYNKEAGAYQVESGTQARERGRRDAILEEISKLQELKNQLGSEYNKSIKALIDAQLNLLAIENDSGSGNNSLAVKNDPSSDNNSQPNKNSDQKKKNILCPNGRPIIQSYFLYGPEGVRKLDPDERLLMAMTVDNKPLISMLQQLSGKQAQSQQPPPDSFRIIVTEQDKVSDSLGKVANVEEKLKTQGKLSIDDLSHLLHALKAQFKE